MRKLIVLFVVMAVIAVFADNPHVTRLAELLDVAIASPQDGDVLTYSAATGKWSNSPAARPQRIDFIGITGNQPDAVLFTPDETANYRLTITGEVSTNTTITMLNGTMNATVGLGPIGSSRSFRASAGVPILFNTFVGTDLNPYNLHFTVEKL